MKPKWTKGKPTKKGFYILDLGYKFLRSDMGYQQHYASAFSDGQEIRSTLDGKLIGEDIEGYTCITPIDYKD